METISGFTEVIEGLQDQFGEGGSFNSPVMSVERLQDQLREATSQNQALQAEVASMREHTEKLRTIREAAQAAGAGQKPSPGSEAECQQFADERDMLKNRLTELGSSSSSGQRDQADQSHALELKRLRQDVESLHNQKEQLRRQLQDQDRERQELQDNFLYVKAQLDKVQMKQAQASADGTGDGQKELQRHQRTLDAATEERNRLASRLENVLRDAEKEKAYHEQSVERVMAANGRLMEEKDRVAREVERLQRLYSDSVNQLQGDINQTNSSGVFRMDSAVSFGGAPVDKEELASLRRRLAETEEAIRKKEQENESLKNRIRKLAVA